jgi:DTW domain-containing protein YfiP
MAERCDRCHLHLDTCVCALVQPLETSTRLVLLLHAREAKKPSNTGSLARLIITNSELHVRGLPGEAPALDHLRAQNAVVLYPSDDATELAPGPKLLIVPDGSWRQASKMPRREPALRDLPRVKLPPLPASALRLREETKDNGFATLVAIAHAMGVMEGAHVRDALLALHDLVAARTLAARGRASAGR